MKKRLRGKSMRLADWINQVGVENVAKIMAVCPAGVRHWRRGHCLPKSDQMFRIKQITNGAVSYDAMIDGFFSQKQ